MSNLEELAAKFWRTQSPAERILLCCTRQNFAAEWERRAVKIATGETVSWNDVLSIAVLHQVTPLIYRNLKACAELAACVPSDVMERFRQAVLLNIRRKGELTDALSDALTYFGGHGIDVLLVKGTSLDVVLWEEPWLTVSQDLDLVLAADWDELDEPVRQTIRLMNQGRPLIDVHCRRHPDLVMNGLLPLDFERILVDAREREVHGHRALLMRIEDELLCACIQSFRKRFFRLKSLCEIAELIDRNPELDWDELSRRAASERCGGIVYVALLAAHLAHGCELPADLRSRIGLSAVSGVFLNALTTRLSFSSFEKLYLDRWVRGKMLGRGLLLPYASLGLRKLCKSLRIVTSQTFEGAK